MEKNIAENEHVLNNSKTLEVKVGEQFEIKAQMPIHYKADGRLSFPEYAFKLISETNKESRDETGNPLIGATIRVYTLEGLVEGDYKIEYQHIFDEKISSIDGYTVNVKK